MIPARGADDICRDIPGSCHAAAPRRAGHADLRAGHEYVRHGALALLAALDVRTGKLFASTRTPPASPHS